VNEQQAVDERVTDERSADEIDPCFVPSPRPNVTAVVLDGEAVLLAEGSGAAHYLDGIATLVWNMFDGAAALDELAEDFAEVFHAESSVVREDLVTLTRKIGRAGLLQGIAFEPPPEPSLWPTGVAVGEPIQPFRLPDAAGVEVGLGDLAGRRVLLVNWSPHCGFCSMIAPGLAAIHPELRARDVELVFIALGSWEENRPKLEEHGLEPTVLFRGNKEIDAFAGVGTPAAYLVDEQGRAASELTIGADKVPGLARSAAGREIHLID
jgi:thiol-disulfide isomerase/thioredoxin